MRFKLKKIDALIIVALIVIAAFVLLRVDAPDILKKEPAEINLVKDDANKKLIVESVSDEVKWSEIEILGDCSRSYLGKFVKEGDEITDCKGTITLRYVAGDLIGTWTFEVERKPPESLIASHLRSVSPDDEGAHFKGSLRITREWWQYTVEFDKESELPGWTATISFNHMAYGDLLGTVKPDVLVVTLHSPDGQEYGGLINKKRGLGLFIKPTLDANSPGVDVTYEDSWAQGIAPNWDVHAEDNDIDSAHEIIIDLSYFAPGSPLWLHSNRAIDKGEGVISEYIFLGCEVNGTVELDGNLYHVKGIGHHEHSWSNSLMKLFIKGWDWCHVTLDNGWNIYYSNYYLTKQITPTKTMEFNPFSSFIITTNNGVTLTLLDEVDVEIKKSDSIFLLLKMPIQLNISAETRILSQILLKTYDVRINMNLLSDNAYDKIWKIPTYVGMKIGRSTVSGKLTWNDEDGPQSVDINGIGTSWCMRH